MRCAVGYEASVSARRVRALPLGVRSHSGRQEEWCRGGNKGINRDEGIISACRMWNRHGGGTCASDGWMVLLFRTRSRLVLVMGGIGCVLVGGRGRGWGVCFFNLRTSSASPVPHRN